MVKIDIEYICDECGKIRKEKTIIHKGYKDVEYIIQNKNIGYLPRNWSYAIDKKSRTKLSCPKCSKLRLINAVCVA